LRVFYCFYKTNGAKLRKNSISKIAQKNISTESLLLYLNILFQIFKTAASLYLCFFLYHDKILAYLETNHFSSKSIYKIFGVAQEKNQEPPNKVGLF
jgi:hypothetical protein